jgi:uncharacterized protein (TIGR02246 family)
MRNRSLASRLVVVTTLAVLAGTGLAMAQDARAAIEAVDKQFGAAVARGDAAAVAALYTRDGQILPPGVEPAKGAAAIRAVFQGFVDAGLTDLTITALEVEAHGDTAIEVSSWTLKGKDGTLVDRGKAIVIWKKEDGRWKLHRDIWNSSVPPKP